MHDKTQQVLAEMMHLLLAMTLPPEILALLSDFLSVMKGGGVVMWILFALGLMLWYALGCRVMILGISPVRSARKRLLWHIRRERRSVSGILDSAAADVVAAYAAAQRHKASHQHFVEEVIIAYRLLMNRYSMLIKTLVIVAPLIGLLGTIIGMIETFDALQTMAVFSQSNSIAGGISKALFTTQMGLIVAVPGLLLGRILDRRQAVLDNELKQIQSMINDTSEVRGSSAGIVRAPGQGQS